MLSGNRTIANGDWQRISESQQRAEEKGECVHTDRQWNQGRAQSSVNIELQQTLQETIEGMYFTHSPFSLPC